MFLERNILRMKNSVYVFLVLIVLSSCLDDVPEDFNNPDSSWNPSFSIAVGQTSLSMSDESGFNTTLLDDLDLSGYPDWIDEIDVEMEYMMPFDMEGIADFSEEIIRVMFRLNIDNGFPAEAFAQVYFLDISDQVVDSVFLNGPLSFDPASVNSEGEIINKNYSQNDIVFENDKIDNLSTVRNVLIQGGINNLSLDTTLVDFYPNYSVDIQMGVQVEVKMALSKNQQNNF
jgi:hypothetical protein